jgi:hypothetical protein
MRRPDNRNQLAFRRVVSVTIPNVLVKINESMSYKVFTQIAELNGSFEYLPKIALICFAFENS